MFLFLSQITLINGNYKNNNNNNNKTQVIARTSLNKQFHVISNNSTEITDNDHCWI